MAEVGDARIVVERRSGVMENAHTVSVREQM